MRDLKTVWKLLEYSRVLDIVSSPAADRVPSRGSRGSRALARENARPYGSVTVGGRRVS